MPVAPATATELAPIPSTARVSAPAMRSAPAAPPAHMPLFSAFAASGVLSAATEGDTGLTRESITSRTKPAVVAVPDRPVPLERTVEEAPRVPRRRPQTPAIRARVVRQPSGFALVGHWLRQLRLRHLALILIGLITIAFGVAFALGYLPEPGEATGPAPVHAVQPAATPPA